MCRSLVGKTILLLDDIYIYICVCVCVCMYSIHNIITNILLPFHLVRESIQTSSGTILPMPYLRSSP
jgi:hypothetical protein